METSKVDYQINLSDIQFLKNIHSSEFVNVYTALWRHQLVCVKEIKGDKRSVHKELKVLTKCIHPRIVQFLGFHKNFMIFEYMKGGDLRNYITKNKNNLSRMKRISMMRDITIGLHYLHNRTPCGIFHRDLKPDNILLSEHGEIKIADFDVSKLVNSKDTTKYKGHTGEKGTYIWIAPEVLNHDAYNYTADIYSLGLLFFYIWNEVYPFHHLNMNSMQLAFAKSQNKIVIPNTLDNTILNSIIMKCCHFDPKKRPNTFEVIKMINEIQ